MGQCEKDKVVVGGRGKEEEEVVVMGECGKEEEEPGGKKLFPSVSLARFLQVNAWMFLRPTTAPPPSRFPNAVRPAFGKREGAVVANGAVVKRPGAAPSEADRPEVGAAAKRQRQE